MCKYLVSIFRTYLIFFANYSEATIYEADNYHQIEMIIPKSNDYSENETKLQIDNIKTALASRKQYFYV